MSHTPGPWFYDSVDTPFVLCDGVCEGGDDSGVRTVFTTDGQETIAVLYPIEKDEVRYYQDANARLIAAAPELYGATYALLEQLRSLCRRGIISEFELAEGLGGDIDTAQAAITKAKGGE